MIGPGRPHPARRQVVAGLGALALSALCPTSAARNAEGFWSREVPASLGVEVVPPSPTLPAPAAGVSPLGLGTRRDGVLLVPTGYRADRPAPLLLWLHGAGGSGAKILRPLVRMLDTLGILTLAPDSRGVTWDMEVLRRGDDLVFLGGALRRVLAGHAVDPARVAVGGFSDGASFALALGLTQQPLFSRVLAFSPGFLQPFRRGSRPEILVAHGSQDTVLPVAKCGRAIVRTLQRGGYKPDYREFTGGHELRLELVEEGLRALLS